MNMYYSSNTFSGTIRLVSAMLCLIFPIVAFPGICSALPFSNEAKEYHKAGYQAQVNGDYHEAMTNYFKAVSIQPNNYVYCNDIGLVYEHLDRLEEAETSYLRSISLNSKYLPPYSNLGFLYKKKQNLAKAAYYFQKRIDLGDSADPWTQIIREELEKLYDSAPLFKEKFVNAQARRMNLQIAQESRQNFKSQMVVANAEYNRGRQLLQDQKTLEAIRAFNSSLAFAPQNLKVVKARDEAYRQHRKELVAERTQTAMQMLEQGHEQAAKKQFSEILTIIPNQIK